MNYYMQQKLQFTSNVNGILICVLSLMLFLPLYAETVKNAKPPLVKRQHLIVKSSVTPVPANLSVSFDAMLPEAVANAPIIAKLEIRNTGTTATEFGLGNDTNSPFHLSVFDPQGTKVATSYNPQDDNLMGLMSLKILHPNESFVQYFIVSALYQFTVPGTYSLQMDYRNLTITKTLKILPANDIELEKQIEILFRPCRGGAPYGELSVGTRAKALESVRNDIMLPYLDWMARTWGNTNPCLALRRINSPRSLALLHALMQRHDKTGRAAKGSLDMDINCSLYDIMADNRSLNSPSEWSEQCIVRKVW